MLEFLWSGSNKPARADTSAAPGEPVQPPDPTPDAEVVAPSVEPSQGGPEPELSAPSPQAELSDPGTPPAVERSLEEEVRRAAASGEDLPSAFGLARRTGRRPGRRLVKPAEPGRALTAQQRLLLLDTWRRSGLPAGDFAALIGLSKHTLYAWKKKFDQQGPAGLLDQPRGGPSGSKLPDLTRRSILMLKEANPSWGCQRISDMLARGPALPASAAAVARVLHEAGYELEEVASRPHPDKVRHFERALPNQLWQTDLFTFVLKRQNRRVYLVAFLDDHSRFITGYGLHASQSSALVLEVLRAALTSYGTPEEILTDNGSQYVTWRGKSAFAKELEKRGIRQVVATPRRPQTLGKIERFWGTLWRECVESAVFLDLGDARQRLGLFIDHYNFQRTHAGIDGLVPADRYLGAAQEVKQALAARVAANALTLARHGVPKAPLYLTGQVGGQPVSLHAEGERVILTGPEGARQEVDLAASAARQELPEPVCPAGVVSGLAHLEPDAEPAPGTSPLDGALPAAGSPHAPAPQTDDVPETAGGGA